jgi:hypothetical protein
MFRNLDLFPSLGEGKETSTLSDPLEGANETSGFLISWRKDMYRIHTGCISSI